MRRIISRVGVQGSQGSRFQGARNVVSLASIFVTLATWAWLIVVSVEGYGFPSVAQRANFGQLTKAIQEVIHRVAPFCLQNSIARCAVTMELQRR
jgi:hypothetical protein